MSQIHEKLQDIPAAQKIETPQSAPSLQVVASAQKKAARKISRKTLRIGLIAGAVILCVGLGIRMFLANKRDSQPKVVQRDPLDEIPDFMRQGQYPNAIELLEKLVITDPQNAAILIDLALAKHKTGDAKAAREILQKAIELRPDHPVVYNNMGRVLAAEGKWIEAQAMYQKALVIKADYPEAIANAATAYEATQQWSQAVAHYEKFLEIDGDHRELHPKIRERLRRLRAFQIYADGSAERSAERVPATVPSKVPVAPTAPAAPTSASGDEEAQ